MAIHTQLSVIATPGRRHVFTAKKITKSPTGTGGGRATRWLRRIEWERKKRLRERILREDQEIVEIIMAIVLSGELK